MVKIRRMWRDNTPESMIDGDCLENRNMLKSKFIDAFINEYGFLIFQKKGTSNPNKYGTTITISGIDYHLKNIGIIVINADKAIVFSSGFNDNTLTQTTKSFDEIGIIDSEGYYQTVIRDLDNIIYTSDNKLGFDLNYPISGEVEFNKKNELQCAFVSKAFTPKIINIDFYLNNPPTTLVPFQISDIKMFPDIIQSNVTAAINEDGNLIEGTYYLAYKYLNADLTDTDYSLIQDPLFIYTKSLINDTPYYFNVEGSKAGESTNKSISLTINNVDKNFDYVVLSAIVISNGQIQAYELKQQLIANNTNLTIKVTTLGSASAIPVNEILVHRDKYYRFSKLAQVSKRLYAIGAKKNDITDYQPYANNIHVRWKSKLVSPSSTDSTKLVQNNFTEKSFCHREVYAFYIHLVLKDGTITKGFHIPGRVPRIGGGINDRTDLSGNTDIFTINNNNYGKKYQFEDTVPSGWINNAGTYGESIGEMCYWENENEFYPNTDDFLVKDHTGTVVDDLRDLPVRHHKMPSIAWMATNIYNATHGISNYGNELLDKLGIYVTNVSFPSDIKDKVESWFISYGERNYQNNLVLGQSHFVCSGESTLVGQTATGLNVNTLYSGDSGAGIALKKNVCRLYDFNLIKKQPVIPATYIRNELFFQTAIHYLGRVGSGALNPLNRLAFHINMLNTTGATTPVDPSSISSDDCRYRKVTDFKYLAGRTEIGSYHNEFVEECALLNLNRDVKINTVGINVCIDNDVYGNPLLLDLPNAYQSYLTNVMSNNKNCYFDFTAQKLIHIAQYSTNDGTALQSLTTYKGDCYITTNTINTFGWGTANPANVSDFSGITTSTHWICESVVNSEMRNHDETDITSFYYPAKGLPALPSVCYLFLLSTSQSRLPFDFVTDYYNNHDFYLLEPFNYRLKGILDFPFRVARSSPFSVESTKNLWKTWLVNDYYESNKNKGIVQDILGEDRNLFIITRQTTFITTGNEQLNIGTANAYIGSGNIFEREPIEIIPSKEGSVGTQNSYCNIMTKYGAVIIDRNYGSVWIIPKQGTPKCISDDGFRQWFLDNLDYNDNQRPEFVEDNPFCLFGFSTVYDLYNDRIILTKKYYELTAAAITLLNANNSVTHLRYIDGRFILYPVTGEVVAPTVIDFSNETYFTNKSFTMSYSLIEEGKNGWVSFHDFLPDFMFNTRNLLLAVKTIVSNSISQSRIFNMLNLNNRGVYFNTSKLDIDGSSTETATPYPSYIIPVFNKGTNISKLFFNIAWIARIFKQPNNTFIQNETFDVVHAWNDFQSTDETPLKVYSFGDDTSNTRQSKGTWFFNKLKDLLRLDIFSSPNPPQPFIKNYKLNTSNSPIDNTKEFQTKRPLIDKYLAIKLLYNNKISSNLQNEIQVIDVDTNVQPVER